MRLKANKIHETTSETLAATPDLLLKHSNETLATYMQNN
jgi:hypothetical protein